jgi:hypothetical protein
VLLYSLLSRGIYEGISPASRLVTEYNSLSIECAWCLTTPVKQLILHYSKSSHQGIGTVEGRIPFVRHSFFITEFSIEEIHQSQDEFGITGRGSRYLNKNPTILLLPKSISNLPKSIIKDYRGKSWYANRER